MIVQILSLFGIKVGVDTIMSAFNRAITQLEVVREQQNKKAADKREQAATLMVAASSAEAEAKRAEAVAKKLRNVVEGA